jgi:O-antigen/teichoic acid export membrane protein
VSLLSRARSLYANPVSWNVAARAAGLLAAALATWLLARLGGAPAVGLYALLRILPATLGVVVAGGLPGAATYFLAGPSRSDRRVPLTLIAVASAGAAAGIALWVVATPILHRLFFTQMTTTLVMAAGARVFTYLAFSSGRACLQGIGDLAASNWVIIGEDLFFVPALIACTAAGLGGPLALVAAMLLGDVATGVLAWGLLWRRRFFESVGWPSLLLARRVYVFGVRGQLGNILLLLNLRLDFAILAAIAGTAPVGAYALASRFAELLRLLPVSVFWVLYPQYARAPRSVASSQARALIPRLGALTLAAAIPLGLASGIVLPAIFGPAFQAAVLPSQILLVGLVAEGIGGVVTPFLYGEGRPGLNSLAMGGGVVVTVVLDLLLIPRFGAVGAAVASSAAYMTTTAVLLLMFWVLARPAEPAPARETALREAR